MTVVDVKTVPVPGRKLKSFLLDIEPFFQSHRPFLYVDVGAYSGEIFAEIFQSPLKPKRAYLIEPNPASFARLQGTVRALEAEELAVCYNLALGAEAGTLRFRADDMMTRVEAAASGDVAAAADGIGEAPHFEVAARPLDALAADFLAPHVSLLKIDVEGFEAEVLAGAAGLLGEQAIDMLFVEAGLDPANPRLTYYRRIEDLLNGHGYRLFRIYEQTNEWLGDSPLLRRVNLAFMSRRFAEGHPFRLSRELFALRQKQAALEARLTEREQALAQGRAGLERLHALEARLTEREQALVQARAGLDRLHALEAEHAALTFAETGARAELEAQARALRDAKSASDRAHAELDAQTRALRDAKSASDRAHGELDAQTRALREAKSASDRAQAELKAQARAATAERGKQAAALKAATDRVAAMESYGRVLEAKYLGLLESRTWRAMEPVRRVTRLLTGKKSPSPFTPQLLAVEAAAPPTPKPPANGRKTAEELIKITGRRDYAALLAREADFAGQDDDQGLFLMRFTRLLALRRLAAYSEAAQVVDEIDLRLGKKHGWLVATFGKSVFVRFVVDATTALTRVGRYQDARRLVDDAVARLDGASGLALLLQRAELAWPYDAGQARSDLAERARAGEAFPRAARCSRPISRWRRARRPRPGTAGSPGTRSCRSSPPRRRGGAATSRPTGRDSMTTSPPRTSRRRCRRPPRASPSTPSSPVSAPAWTGRSSAWS